MHLIILGIILAIAAILRFDQIGGPSLWVDEIWSIEISTGRGTLHSQLPAGVIQNQPIVLTGLAGAPPWWHIWTGITGVPYPPLYHIFLRWWMDLFGNGTAQTRWLSALFSLAAIPLFFDVCRLLHGRRIALFAAGIMALSPAMLDFAQQTRCYTLAILLAVAAADLLVRIEKFGASRRRIGLLFLFIAASMLTYYFSIFLLAALGLYALIRLHGRDRVRTVAAFVVAAMIFLIVFGIPFYHQLHTLPALNEDYLRDETGHNVRASLLRALSVPGKLVVGESFALALPWVRTSLVLLAVLTILVPTLRWAAGRGDLLLWVLWFFGNIGLLLAWDVLHGSTLLHLQRFAILAGPAIYALIASYDWPRRPALRDGVAILAVALLTIVVTWRHVLGVTASNDWRLFATLVDQNIPADDLLVFYNDSPWLTPGMWYMGLTYYAPQSNHPWMVLYQHADQKALDQLRSHKLVWLIGIDPIGQGREILPGWKPTRFFKDSAGTACEMTPDD